MKKLPFFILMAALSALHPAAYAETETAKPSTTTETKTGEQPAAATTEAAPADTDKKAEGEQPAATTTDTQPAADAKQADSGEKKADKKGGDEPDCN